MMLTAAIVVVFIGPTGVLMTPPPSEDTLTQSTSADDPSDALSQLNVVEFTTAELTVNMDEWLDLIESNQSVSITLGDSTLNLLSTGDVNIREIQFNSPDPSSYTHESHHYQFNIGDDSGLARMVFADQTLRGFICSMPSGSDEITLHNLMVTDRGSYPEVELTVLSREASSSCTTISTSGTSTGGASSYPDNPPDPPEERDVVPDVHLETSYFDGWSDNLDAMIHADDAFLVQDSMWDDYTGNDMQPQYWSTSYWGEDHIEPTGAGDYCTQKLRGFSEYITDRGRDLVPNGVFTLISGDDDMGCNGSAWLEDWGVLADDPDNINYGLDRTDQDYYGKSNENHLGVLIAQEIGHNWGHKDHECETVGGEYSAMADSGDCEAPWDDRKFWLHYEDQDKPSDAEDSAGHIIDGTADYDDDGETGIMSTNDGEI